MSRAAAVYVIGAGGHAKVIIRAMQDLGLRVAAVFDDDPRRQGLCLLGAPVVGPVERIAWQPRRPTVIAIGDNAVRRQIAQRYDLPWATVVHPQALVDPSVRVGAGTVVLARAVVQVDCLLGAHVIVNHAVSVDHDCVIEDFVHLAPGVRLAGAVTVQNGAFVGIGAAALPGVRIGAGTIVGACAAVLHDLPPQVTAVGVPARIIGPRRQLRPEAGAIRRTGSEAA